MNRISQSGRTILWNVKTAFSSRVLKSSFVLNRMVAGWRRADGNEGKYSFVCKIGPRCHRLRTSPKENRCRFSSAKHRDAGHRLGIEPRTAVSTRRPVDHRLTDCHRSTTSDQQRSTVYEYRWCHIAECRFFCDVESEPVEWGSRHNIFYSAALLLTREMGRRVIHPMSDENICVELLVEKRASRLPLSRPISLGKVNCITILRVLL